MTLQQAKKLHAEATGQDDYTDGEWRLIKEEMEAVVEAKSDRAAAGPIRWWDCWTRNYTATAMATKIRRIWKEMNHEHPSD